MMFATMTQSFYERGKREKERKTERTRIALKLEAFESFLKRVKYSNFNGFQDYFVEHH